MPNIAYQNKQFQEISLIMYLPDNFHKYCGGQRRFPHNCSNTIFSPCFKNEQKSVISPRPNSVSINRYIIHIISGGEGKIIDTIQILIHFHRLIF